MKVILTNKQFNIIAEVLKARFTVSEVRITFLNKRIDEAFGGRTTPPHRQLAINLAGNKIHKYRLVNSISRNNTTDPNNPFNNVPCAGVSYYFEASFKVDGKPVKGVIRVSDHPATPVTFAKRGYDYGLSIVFDNNSTRVGKHNSIEATVFEYVTDALSRDVANKIRSLTSEFIDAMGMIKIENGRVVSPSGIDFQRLNMSSGKQKAEDITLVTSWASKRANFMTPDKSIQLVAVRDDRGNYHLSDEDIRKFNYGDTIHFYKINNGIPIELGKSITVDK